MDALKFAQENIDELRARFAEIGAKGHEISANYDATPEEVVINFFASQGLTFQNIDIPKVLELVKSPVNPPVKPING